MIRKHSILLSSDHAGFELKQHLAGVLRGQGWDVIDLGTHSTESVDYPDFAKKAVEGILNKDAALGIIICGTGIGISIAANRHKGIRCAVCTSPEMATLARQHNDANLLALGARLITPAQAEAITTAFLSTDFESGRHENRVKKLDC